MRLLSFNELEAKKGIRFSRQHLHRLIKARRFPRPIKLGENTNGWDEDEVEAYLLARKKERDQLQMEAA
jgi:prophage regulatory protein